MTWPPPLWFWPALNVGLCVACVGKGCQLSDPYYLVLAIFPAWALGMMWANR